MTGTVSPATTTELERAVELYRTYADDLAAVIDRQRALLAGRPGLVPQLDDVEAELTYLYLRAGRPATVMELGTFHGWSTTWILSALRDNDSHDNDSHDNDSHNDGDEDGSGDDSGGRLHSFDRVDHVLDAVPPELARGRWTFVPGDVRHNLHAVPSGIGYLFVDADHGRRFARWYLEHLFPLVPAGTPVSVHDVFHLRWARPGTEGATVLRQLRRDGTPWFTAARHRAPDALAALEAVRSELGLVGARGTRRNPMIWFNR